MYELSVNGQRVGNDWFTPGWTNYNKRLQYQTYDVTDSFTTGENRIGALLGNGWFAGEIAFKEQKLFYGNRRALLCQLHIKLANDQELIVKSDGSWLHTSSPILMSELYHGETYDARLEKDITALNHVTNQTSDQTSGWSRVEETDYSYDSLVSQENMPVQVVETIVPVEILKTPEGHHVLDMGQNMVGRMKLTVRASEGTEIKLEHAEVLDKEGNFYTENLRAAKQTVTYICKGSDEDSSVPETYFPRFSSMYRRTVHNETKDWAGRVTPRFLSVHPALI